MHALLEGTRFDEISSPALFNPALFPPVADLSHRRGMLDDVTPPIPYLWRVPSQPADTGWEHAFPGHAALAEQTSWQHHDALADLGLEHLGETDPLAYALPVIDANAMLAALDTDGATGSRYLAVHQTDGLGSVPADLSALGEHFGYTKQGWPDDPEHPWNLSRFHPHTDADGHAAFIAVGATSRCPGYVRVAPQHAAELSQHRWSWSLKGNGERYAMRKASPYANGGPSVCIYLHREVMRLMLLTDSKLRRAKAREFGLNPNRQAESLVTALLQAGIVHHTQGNTEDDHAENLELVTPQANVRMSKLNSHNTSGYNGVMADGAYWKAVVLLQHGNKLLRKVVARGLPSPEMAAVARCLGMLVIPEVMGKSHTPREHDRQPWISASHLIAGLPCPQLGLKPSQLPQSLRQLLYFAAKRQNNRATRVDIRLPA